MVFGLPRLQLVNSEMNMRHLLLLPMCFAAIVTLPMVAQTHKAVAPVVPTYSQVSFDPPSVRLPPHFMGNDIVRLYEAYKIGRAAQKTEFETDRKSVVEGKRG